MLEFLRDPAVQTVLAVLALVIAAAIYWKQRTRKSLGYEVLSISPLSSVSPSTLGGYQKVGLKFTFDGVVISQAHFITARFANTGNVPIKKEDYDEPMSLSFGKSANVLAYRGLEKKPETIQLSLKPDAGDVGKVVVDPTLLNSKDSFVIEVLVSGFDGKITPRGRIVGVKEIQDVRGGLPASREEDLVDEAFLMNLLISFFSIISGAYLVASISIPLFILGFWRKIKLKIARQTSQTTPIPAT